MSGRMRYVPALDGLRGLSVAAVLLFHAELSWARGGYLGVSTFFTLSGFLITTLLLREHAETGTVSMRAFYERRARRLLPALALALAGVVLFGVTVADSSQLRELRGDVLAAMAYVANWRFALGDASYTDLFASPSPALHLWSIAIEEQFYLLFPPLLTLVLARRAGRDPVAPLAAAAGASILVLVASGVADTELDLIYFGTHTRASELLIGALLAALAARGTTTTPAAIRHLRWAGPVALTASIATWATVDQSTEVLYRGGFSAYAALSATVIAAAITPGNPIHHALRIEPLRSLGRVSYGVYLFHWPIYLWLTPQRTDLDTAPLLAARLTLSIALGFLSFHLLEHPVRTRTLLRSSRAAAIGALATAAALLAGTLVTTAAPPVDDLQIVIDRQAELQAALAKHPDMDRLYTQPNPPGVDALRVGVFGDSTALVTGRGLEAWMNGPDHEYFWKEDLAAPGVVAVSGSTTIGCSLLGQGKIRFRNEESVQEAGCDNWRDYWLVSAEKDDPDVAVIQIGPWEVVDRVLPGDDVYRAPGDPVFDAALERAVEEATTLLLARGVRVLWILAPHIESGTVDGVPPATSYPESDPARIDRLNEILRAVAAQHPEHVGVVDLPGYLATLPGGEMDTTIRPDLTHFTLETSAQVAASWLGPEIVRVANEVTGPAVSP